MSVDRGAADSDLSRWRVLLLCVGRSTEMVRDELVRWGEELGFEITVYDHPGYRADPVSDTVSACIKEIAQYDIVLALADEEEGTEVNVDLLENGVREFLINSDLLPPPESAIPTPTIFQLEVLAAKRLGKPTLVLMTTAAQQSQREVARMLAAKELNLIPRVSSPRRAEDLIAAEEWSALAEEYDVPSGRIASFRHLLFLQRLERVPPNFVRYYDPKSLEALKVTAADALASVPLALIREAHANARSRIEVARPPLGPSSIGDLLRADLILAPPYLVRSGEPSSDELYSPSGGDGRLREWLLERRSVLLLGHPGLGKSTLTLLVYSSLDHAATSVPPVGAIWGSWRDLTVPSRGWESTLRHFMGLAHERAPWPASLPLPNLRWVLLLDGLDESPLPGTEMIRTLEELAAHTTLLVSCRLNDYGRYVDVGRSSFEMYVELRPWDEDHIERYAQALETNGRQAAADAVRSLLQSRRRPEVISYPLWLSMLTYLAESGDGVDDVNDLDDYELLRRTTAAVAGEEMKRHGGSHEDAAELKSAWEVCAWLLQEQRRTAQRLYTRDLEQALHVLQDDALFRATLSALEVSDEVIRGFQHEILHDFWLGQYIARRLPAATAEDLIRLLGSQRRGFANSVVRRRLAREGRKAEAANTLRGSFDEVGQVPRAEFVKNQILYFLGRLDDGSATQGFLAAVWRSDEPRFVRYSAAFTGALIGAPGVEEEYYETLRSDPESDALNRGYHLYYHGDVDVRETEMPYHDDGTVSADRTIDVLIDRLRLKKPTNRRLRRIELFTLRRFIETRGGVNQEVGAALNAVLAELGAEAAGEDEWATSVQCEIAVIRALKHA